MDMRQMPKLTITQHYHHIQKASAIANAIIIDIANKNYVSTNAEFSLF